VADEIVAEEDVELAPSKSGISKKLIIIIAVVFIILMGGAIGITVMLVGGSDKGASNEDEHSEVVEHDEPVIKPAIYFELEPDFIINFESNGKANFLSVQIQIMARENAPIQLLEAQMPVLRNNILLLLSAQKYDVIRTIEGKNKLRGNILKILNDIIHEENEIQKKKDSEKFHKIPNIEAIYFTGFIMQ